MRRAKFQEIRRDAVVETPKPVQSMGTPIIHTANDGAAISRYGGLTPLRNRLPCHGQAYPTSGEAGNPGDGGRRGERMEPAGKGTGAARACPPGGRLSGTLCCGGWMGIDGSTRPARRHDADHSRIGPDLPRKRGLPLIRGTQTAAYETTWPKTWQGCEASKLGRHPSDAVKTAFPSQPGRSHPGFAPCP